MEPTGAITTAAILSLIKDFGWPLALVIFFVLEGRRRERDMTSRIRTLEDQYSNKLVDLVEDNAAALKETTAALSNNTEILRAVGDVLNRLERRDGMRPFAG